MRRFLRWVVGVPIVILVVGFAVANRRWVTLSLDPFSQEAPSVYLDLPLWLLFFAGILVGLIVGWSASWLAQGRHRKAAREQRSEIQALQSELAGLRKNAPPPAPRGEMTPYEGGFL